MFHGIVQHRPAARSPQQGFAPRFALRTAGKVRGYRYFLALHHGGADRVGVRLLSEAHGLLGAFDPVQVEAVGHLVAGVDGVVDATTGFLRAIADGELANGSPDGLRSALLQAVLVEGGGASGRKGEGSGQGFDGSKAQKKTPRWGKGRSHQAGLQAPMKTLMSLPQVPCRSIDATFMPCRTMAHCSAIPETGHAWRTHPLRWVARRRQEGRWWEATWNGDQGHSTDNGRMLPMCSTAWNCGKLQQTYASAYG